jgi:FAD/FMN-containing dehydrogenase
MSRPRDLAPFITGLGDIPYETSANIVRQKSRDFYWYSPVLKPLLDGCVGDIVVQPRHEADVLAVARLAVAHRLPVIARGGGTGNYGQAVPLDGGIILDMRALAAVSPVEDGIVRVGPGALLRDIDLATRPQGWELRMLPSTYRTATIGGFVAGGSGGIGSITYGSLRDPGSILAARVVTMEPEPRVVELRGASVNRVHHAYGTNGIITELTLPLAPALPWIDLVVAFDDFTTLARYCAALAAADAITKKLIAAIEWPIPRYFRTMAVAPPEDASLGCLMVAANGLEPTLDLLARFGGRVVYQKSETEVAAEKLVPVYEFTWNHTTLQLLKVDKSFTYLQAAFPGPDPLAKVEYLRRLFGDEVPMHLELIRADGEVAWRALPIVRYTTPERLDEIIRIFEENGCPVFNPHTYILEDGGMKETDPEQLAFKRETDPFGLLNPGKMRGWGVISPGF